MKVVKNLLSIILSFTLMLGIVSSTIITYTNRMLKKDYILSKFNEIDLYSQVLNEVNSEFEKYIYQSGMDENIIEDICTREKVEEDINSIVYSLYNNNDIEINTFDIEDKLDIKIDDFIKSQNRKISKEEEANVKKFKEAVLNAYKDAVGFYQIKSDVIQDNLPKVTSALEKYKNITNVATIVIIFLLIVVNIKTIFTGINYISISALASGMVLLLINWLINSKIEVNNLMILVDSLSNAFICLINSLLDSIVKVGIWCVFAGIVGILFNSIKNMTKQKS